MYNIISARTIFFTILKIFLKNFQLKEISFKQF